MPQILVNLLRKMYWKRCYCVVAESSKLEKGGSIVKQNVRKSASTNGSKEEIFWMRDPKSGNWIPENHFGEVDVAELRERVLPKTNLRQD